MKKLLILMTVIVSVSMFPLAASANGHHNQGWRDQHHQQWKNHEMTWKEYDREWKEHRHDRHWREVHAREWHDWYQWHRDNDSEFHLEVSDDEFILDIDL